MDKDSILAADDLKCEEVEVPEWGGTFYVKGLNGVQRDEVEQHFASGKKNAAVDIRGWKVKVVIMCLLNDKREPVFELSDAAALNLKSGLIIDKLFGVAAELSGLTEASLEDMAGN